MVVPAVLSSKEEAITPEEFGVILGTDEDARKRALETAEAKTNRTMKKNPLLKTMIQGSFHEMIKRGHFDKYKC